MAGTTSSLPNILTKLAGIISRVSSAEERLSTASAGISGMSSSLAGKAPTAHAASAGTYGLATSSVYGHVRLSDATNVSSATSGTAATPKAVNAAMAMASSAMESISALNANVSGCLATSGGTVNGSLTVSGGSLYAPTAAAKSNDTHVATTAWVHREMLNIVYPVGSVYMSVNNVSPATFLGGTWAAISGKFLIGADGSTYKAKGAGGASSHVITANELPKHTHAVTVKANGKHSHTRGTLRIQGTITSLDENEPLTLADSFTATGALSISNKNEPDNVNTDRGYMLDSALKKGGHRNTITLDTNLHNASGWSGATSTEANHSHDTTVAAAGGSVAMSIMPPYYAVYMWVRTA